LTVNKVSDFESAIRQKLLREIALVQVRLLQGAGDRGPIKTDCFIGEKRRVR
jgi:hypothetical protein